MFTTADLPLGMQFRPEDQVSAAARESGVTVDCRHGDPRCPTCLAAAARAILAEPEPTV